MGNLVLKAVSKNGYQSLKAPPKLFDVAVTGLKGENYGNFGKLMEGKKVGIVVNVATK